MLHNDCRRSWMLTVIVLVNAAPVLAADLVYDPHPTQRYLQESNHD